MKIELKSIVMIPSLSGPFDAFTAKLYVDGVLGAFVKNEGRDIVNQVDPSGSVGVALVEKAEAYCLKLPPDHFEMDGLSHEIDMNLSNFIDKLVTEHMLLQIDKKFANRIKAAMKKGIVIGIPGDDHSIKQFAFKSPIDTILAKPGGEKIVASAIEQSVLPKLKDGVIILNTNIPVRILQQAGIKEDQYLKAAIEPKAEKKPGRKLKS